VKPVKEYRNDVMHLAFSNARLPTEQTTLVLMCVRALHRFQPSRYGGWRVINKRRKQSGKRNR
jgi:hypothetical protein